MIIAVDFDGTCVTHEYPKMGHSIGAEAVLKRLTDAGHALILWTVRDGSELRQAVEWFQEKGIPLMAVNDSPAQKSWSDSPKAFAHLYIDDSALGAPLVYPVNSDERPYIDWRVVEQTIFHIKEEES